MEKTGAITQWQIEGTISAVPAPFFPHPAEEESGHRRPGLPLGLRPPPLLPSQGLYSLAVFFLPPSTSPLSKIMAVVTETTLLAAHLPSSIALLFFFFWFLLTTQLLGKCLHQLFSLPYLSFAQQPIPTWLPFHQLNLNGSCRLTSTLPAAKTAEHISVFTFLSLSEAFNPVG